MNTALYGMIVCVYMFDSATCVSLDSHSQAAEPLGVIVLERCHPDRIQHDSRPYSFMLSFEGDDTRTYFLSAYSQDDLKGWMKAIKMAS